MRNGKLSLGERRTLGKVAKILHEWAEEQKAHPRPVSPRASFNANMTASAIVQFLRDQRGK